MFDKKSTFFENIHTHRFIAEVLSACALRTPPLFLDVLRNEVDDGGIDLLLSSGKQIRPIQLKARAEKPTSFHYQVSDRLLMTEGGAVIWIVYSKKKLTPIHYFALVGSLNQRIVDFTSFEPATKKKGGMRTGYSLVSMSSANHKRVSTLKLAQLLFPEAR